MNKIKTLFIIFLLFFINIRTIYAECSPTEINRVRNAATNVKFGYEEMEGELPKGTYSPPDGIDDEEWDSYVGKYMYFKIYISNLTEDLYVKVKNDLNNEEKIYYYSDTNNGTIYFEEKDIRAIVNYTATIYSANCSDMKLHTIYLTTPRYNSYSELELCSGIENFYLCHKYLTVDDVSYGKFIDLANEYKAGKLNNQGEVIDNEKDRSFWNKNKGLIIITVIIFIAGGGALGAFYIKKQGEARK